MDVNRSLFLCLASLTVFGCDHVWSFPAESKAPEPIIEWDAPVLPVIGERSVILISPRLLELRLVTTKQPDPARQREWDFVNSSGECRLPSPASIKVVSGGRSIPVVRIGFQRRVLYAPLKVRDLRIGNHLYLQLGDLVREGEMVEIENPDQKLWPKSVHMSVRAEPKRWSPVLHVNQTGYLSKQPKVAMVGYFLGSLGEMDLLTELEQTNSSSGPATIAKPGTFKVLDARTGAEVFAGKLELRPDRGYPFSTYTRVYQADFTPVGPGEYQLFLAGIGTSFSFFIDDAVAGAFARTYALGLYHQRCGTDNELPFTRFTHAPCHTNSVEVPDGSNKFKSANESLAKESSNFKDNPRHTAPQLKNMAASLYPFVRKQSLDLSGGHHDAGDYSKYTINSAAFIHHLVFATDAFPGVKDLDNLGLPESGDGKSDVLQEAKWEADFLAKMQDADGGFYFLVYPRDREYENDVTPDKGDPQIVFPKTTSATAAAVAALAQCGSSPTFKKQFPEAARHYLEVAAKGWQFLESAIAKYGKDGAYQKITHYGDEFMHDDELTWAACELFLATGEQRYHKRVMEWLNPTDPGTRRWGWWRLYEAYGCATRSYAFGARTGRVKRDQLSPLLLDACENEIAAAGEDQLRRANESAYGTSFPSETKRALSAGWYFSSDAAFDLAVACQISYPERKDPRAAMKAALISNLNYEQGCNPVNVTYVTGLGSKRQREIVHQYSQNDRRVMPLSGIPLGNVQAGFGWNYVYNKELDSLSFPSDSDVSAPYPFYDRWGDGFNLSQEFVILNQARALAYLSWLMSETSLKNQTWRSAVGHITPTSRGGGEPSIKLVLNCPEIDLSSARIVWETSGTEPVYTKTPTFMAASSVKWVEAEAQLPDGRRVFGVWPSGKQ